MREVTVQGGGSATVTEGNFQPVKVPAKTAKPQFREPEHLLLRLVLLGLLLLLMNLWAQRHLNIALLEEWKNTTLLAIIIPLLASILEVIGSKSTQKGVRARFRKGVALSVSNVVLIPLALVFATLTLLFSSVTVVADGAQLPLEVKIREQVRFPRQGASPQGQRDTQTLEEKSDALRFVKRTNPFGRSYVVEAGGYLPYSFDLYPWIGARIRIDRDLTLAPSVLIRVPVGLLAALAGARIELWSTGKNATTIAEVTTGANNGAALFGRKLQMESWRLADWQHELRVAGADGSALSSSYLKWKNHLVVKLPRHLEPGQKLEAKFITRDKTVAALGKFTLTSEPLQDILLNPSEGAP